MNIRILALLAITASAFGETATAIVGQKVTLSTTYEGSPATATEWAKDGFKASDSPQIVIASVQAAHAGSYVATVTNEFGVGSSAPVALIIAFPPTGTPPQITAGPRSLVVPKKADAVFTVTATGTDPLGYQWKKGSTNISGATNATITVANVKPSSAGTYSVTVKNANGAATVSATLQVR